ncbi:MAG: hypothetical protein GDA40_09795 [Rhodobacteraceae bacterium]|nr:hypothetical protein [Paracoccaceae bacterium]
MDVPFPIGGATGTESDLGAGSDIFHGPSTYYGCTGDEICSDVLAMT